MNFNRLPKSVTNSFVSDPYACLIHYRRSFKLLKQLKDAGSPILAVGNKNESGFSWKNDFDGIKHAQVTCDNGSTMSDSVLSAASKNYHLLLCFDPVLFANAIQGLNIPVMSVATSAEILQHPEILRVSDYLLPAPTARADMALRQLIYGEVFDPKKTEPLV